MAVEKVESAMRTPGGQWRVEVVRRGRTSVWYRVVNGDNVIDWLSIAGVEQILGEAGVDVGTLVPADVDPAPNEDRRDGAGAA